MIRRLVAMVAALGLLLALAGPALATVALSQDTPISWDDPEFQGTAEECEDDDELLGALQPGEVRWHFVLNQTTATSATLTAEFTDAGTKVEDNGPPFASGTLHFYVVTGQDTLESASVDATDGNLILSHICSEPDFVIPEAPLALLLPMVAIGVLGGYLLINRRKTAQAV